MAPADWADTYYDTNISYYEDDLNANATVYTDSSTDAGYDGSTDASDDFGVDFPLVINLVGAQVHTVSEQNSGVRFDVTGKGGSAPTGWIMAGEGILVRDPSDATVTSAAQFVPSFSNLARIEARRQRLSAKPPARMESSPENRRDKSATLFSIDAEPEQGGHSDKALKLQLNSNVVACLGCPPDM